MNQRSKVCQSCLSSDRRLTSLKKIRGLLRAIKLYDLKYSNGGICWECKAVIMKFFKFTYQIRQAQEVLISAEEIKNLQTKSYSLLESKLINSNETRHYYFDEQMNKDDQLTKQPDNEVECIENDIGDLLYDDGLNKTEISDVLLPSDLNRKESYTNIDDNISELQAKKLSDLKLVKFNEIETRCTQLGKHKFDTRTRNNKEKYKFDLNHQQKIRILNDGTIVPGSSTKFAHGCSEIAKAVTNNTVIDHPVKRRVNTEPLVYIDDVADNIYKSSNVTPKPLNTKIDKEYVQPEKKDNFKSGIFEETQMDKLVNKDDVCTNKVDDIHSITETSYLTASTVQNSKEKSNFDINEPNRIQILSDVTVLTNYYGVISTINNSNVVDQHEEHRNSKEINTEHDNHETEALLAYVDDNESVQHDPLIYSTEQLDIESENENIQIEQSNKLKSTINDQNEIWCDQLDNCVDKNDHSSTTVSGTQFNNDVTALKNNDEVYNSDTSLLSKIYVLGDVTSLTSESPVRSYPDKHRINDTIADEPEHHSKGINMKQDNHVYNIEHENIQTKRKKSFLFHENELLCDQPEDKVQSDKHTYEKSTTKELETGYMSENNGNRTQNNEEKSPYIKQQKKIHILSDIIVLASESPSSLIASCGGVINKINNNDVINLTKKQQNSINAPMKQDNHENDTPLIYIGDKESVEENIHTEEDNNLKCLLQNEIRFNQLNEMVHKDNNSILKVSGTLNISETNPTNIHNIKGTSSLDKNKLNKIQTLSDEAEPFLSDVVNAKLPVTGIEKGNTVNEKKKYFESIICKRQCEQLEKQTKREYNYSFNLSDTDLSKSDASIQDKTEISSHDKVELNEILHNASVLSSEPVANFSRDNSEVTTNNNKINQLSIQPEELNKYQFKNYETLVYVDDDEEDCPEIQYNNTKKQHNIESDKIENKKTTTLERDRRIVAENTNSICIQNNETQPNLYDQTKIQILSDVIVVTSRSPSKSNRYSEVNNVIRNNIIQGNDIKHQVDEESVAVDNDDLLIYVDDDEGTMVEVIYEPFLTSESTTQINMTPKDKYENNLNTYSSSVTDGKSDFMPKDLSEKLFPMLADDEVSSLAKKDPLICAFCLRLINKMSMNRDCLIYKALSEMRDLGKLLAHLQAAESGLITLVDALVPRHYDTILDAILSVSDNSLAKALRMSSILIECAEIVISDFRSYEKLARIELILIKDMLKLMKDNLRSQISLKISQEANLNKIQRFQDSQMRLKKDQTNNSLNIEIHRDIYNVKKGPILSRKEYRSPLKYEQKATIIKYFAKFIKNSTMPKRSALSNFIHKHPKLFSSNCYRKIYKYIYSMCKAMRRSNNELNGIQLQNGSETYIYDNLYADRFTSYYSEFLSTWSKEQISIIKNRFAYSLANKILPSRAEVEAFLERNEHMFYNNNCVQILLFLYDNLESACETPGGYQNIYEFVMDIIESTSDNIDNISCKKNVDSHTKNKKITYFNFTNEKMLPKNLENHVGSDSCYFELNSSKTLDENQCIRNDVGNECKFYIGSKENGSSTSYAEYRKSNVSKIDWKYLLVSEAKCFRWSAIQKGLVLKCFANYIKYQQCPDPSTIDKFKNCYSILFASKTTEQIMKLIKYYCQNVLDIEMNLGHINNSSPTSEVHAASYWSYKQMVEIVNYFQSYIVHKVLPTRLYIEKFHDDREDLYFNKHWSEISNFIQKTYSLSVRLPRIPS